ncbi:MAG: transcription antitermination factor NusB, partial [Acidimicrobiales bacterium]
GRRPRPDPPAGTRPTPARPPAPGSAARRVAVDALARIDETAAFANLVLPGLLEASSLARRDRAFVTDLVYGSLRRRRACDWLIDRWLLRPVEPHVRAALRLGAYQLAFLGTPPHAAVDATVAAVSGPGQSLVNAVLRRVAAELGEAGGVDALAWPSPAVLLSYPDWIVSRLSEDLGEAAALDALAAMNDPGPPAVRPDGYVQGLASQAVVELCEPAPGMRAVELCAAPGGKATLLAERGCTVAALDVAPGRAGLIAANVNRLGASGAVWPVVSDGRRPAVRPGRFDLVLVDAPCSGLGVLGRRADARWRLDADAPERLAVLQGDLVRAAVDLLAPGGLLVYSACTLTAVETLGVDAALAAAAPALEPLALPPPPWRPWGRGGLLLPAAGGDGMAVLRLRRPPEP